MAKNVELREEMINYLVENLLPALDMIDGTGIKRSGQLRCDYSESCAEFECFSRILYGFIPLIHNKNETAMQYISTINEGIIMGCDPKSSLYWGEYTGPSQKEVECIPLILYLIICKDISWDTFDEPEKMKIATWLNQVNSGKIYDSNWLFFRVIVNQGLKILDMDYDEKALQNGLQRINRLYIGDGYYQDGKQKRVDYYNAFAFHFYGLIFSKLAPNDKNSKIFRDRAVLFGKSFVLYHSSHGDMIPMGRSLTYKMAMASFWSAEVYSDCYSHSIGEVKGIISRSFDFWKKQNIYDGEGMITVGYKYPNHFMSENYNTYGSSYWGYKFFLVLLCDNEDFWSSSTEALPERSDIVQVKAIDSCFTSNIDRSIVMLYPNVDTGSSDVVLNFPHKYLKFVYSNAFGFSVPRSNDEFARGGYDNSLSSSDDEQTYFMRKEICDCRITDGYLYSMYPLQRGVLVKTYIVLGPNWHVRIHLINTDHQIYIADSGFSLQDSNSLSEKKERKTIELKNEHFCTGIQTHTVGEPKIQQNCSMTNLLFPETKMLVSKAKLKAGSHVVVNTFYASTIGENFELPIIEVDNNVVTVRDKEIFETIDTSKAHMPTHRIVHEAKKNARVLKKVAIQLRKRFS